MNRNLFLTINFENIYFALKKLLELSHRKIARVLRWLQDNPQKTLMIILAIKKASLGEYSDLLTLLFYV